jgi:hypothetical protein
MKLAAYLAIAAVMYWGTAVLAVTPTAIGDRNLDQIQALKDDNVTGDPNPQGLVGGEDIPNAVAIPALPFLDSGNTCGYLHDYDETCPFGGSLSPDVVYSYAPGTALDLDISLCESGYDTKVFVYENSEATMVACNDDACGSDGFRSELLCVPVSPPNTYYVVVDGYGGACGDYDLRVSECEPCSVPCPPGSMAEGEGPCATDTIDDFNCGCAYPGPIFSHLTCSPTGLSICGDYGGFLYFGAATRDTDWYEIEVPPGGQTITWCVTGSVPTLLGIIDGREGCGAPEFWDFAITDACGETGCVTGFLEEGIWWRWVGTRDLGLDVLRRHSRRPFLCADLGRPGKLG